MKLKKFKDVLKSENKGNRNMETNTHEMFAERMQYNSDAKKLVSLERLHSSDYRKLQTSQISRNAAFKKKYDVEIERGSKVISYVPKNNIRFIPSDIKSYGNNQNLDFSKTNFAGFSGSNKMPEFYSISNVNSNLNNQNNNNNFSSIYNYYQDLSLLNNNSSNINSDSPKAKTQNNFFKFSNNNFNNNNNYNNNNNNKNNLSNPVNNIDMDYLNFKTNFLLRFTKNINNYEKILQLIETLVHNNKKHFYTSMEKLKILSEKKDKILLETNQKLQNIATWKETLIFLFEFECLWQKLSESLLKELKKALDSNIILMKKNKDQDEELTLRSKKIEELNEFIRINDIHTKISKYNKTLEMVNDVKAQYEKKGNKTLIEMFNMENQILDLTSLLDKDKKYMHKYIESLELLEAKKKELEEVRLKLNQDIEEKKIKISQTILEKHEIHLKNIELQKEIEELNEIQKQTKNEHIEFHTQIKILKQTLQEKEENIQMLANEVETWMSDLYKERIMHYNAEQNVSALELKLSSIKR